MTSRFATPDDVETYLRVRFDYFASEGWAVINEMKESLIFNLRIYFETHLNQDFFVSFLERDAVVVSTAFLTVNTIPPNLFAPTGKYGTILNVLTYPDYRRKGYATLVLKSLIRKAGEEGLSYLQLSASKAGQPLYRKLGFNTRENTGFTEMRLALLS
ncbi:GNAT family N-acetyltransferase [Oscillospiraceae bacterium WX1]